MKIISIKGVISDMGAYGDKFNGIRIFSSANFRDEGNNETKLTQLKVPKQIAEEVMKVGTRGVFLFTNNKFLGAKVGEREYHSDFLRGNLTTTYVVLGILLLVGLLSATMLIGIPIAILAVWGLIKAPKWRNEAVLVARNAGFTQV